jgi:hypothetical protein
MSSCRECVSVFFSNECAAAGPTANNQADWAVDATEPQQNSPLIALKHRNGHSFILKQALKIIVAIEKKMIFC